MKSNFNHTYNQQYIDHQYKIYKENPESLDSDWLSFFDGFSLAKDSVGEGRGAGNINAVTLAQKVIDLFHRYGHLSSNTNPMCEADLVDTLKFDTKEDLDTIVPTFGYLDSPNASLKDLIARLREVYLGSIGVETYKQPKQDVYDAVHQLMAKPWRASDKKEKKYFLKTLMKGKMFEEFIHKKFQGDKRFSLEGAETFSIVLEKILDKAAGLGAGQVFLAMAHRGRINTMCNTLNKSLEDLFCHFESTYIPSKEERLGDVKYHMGLSTKLRTLSDKD